MSDFWQEIVEFLKRVGTNILESVAVFLLAIVVVRLASIVLRSILSRTKVEGTAASFIISIVKAAIYLLVFFVILKILGIDTSGAVAIVAASGLALGLALQDSISNVAAGVILLFTKPFKENDSVAVGTTEGKIKKIKITTIEILTADNILISIPNGKVVNSEIKNFSARPTRRIVVSVPVSYKNDVTEVKNTLFEIIARDDRILSNPTSAVEIGQLAGYYVEFKVKMWVSREDYWDVLNNFNEKVIAAFKEKEFSIPFNRLYEKNSLETKGDDNE